ncbi:MAG: DUF255 domain-containing protein [Chitinophagales bacterium]|nr:DUF255 domain-containing protein [Chitinophagales bacterium]
MRLYQGLILSFIIGFIFPADAQNKIKWASWDAVDEYIQKGDKKFMIYICYGGCKWCRQMEDSTFSDSKIAQFVNSNFIPLRLNASSKEKIVINDKTYAAKQQGNHEFSELAIRLLNGNMTFPSIVFMDEQFDKITSYNQFIEQDNFRMLLAYYAGDYYKRILWKRFVCEYSKEKHFNTLVRGN